MKICVDDLCRLFAHAGGIFQLVRRGFLHRAHALELGHQCLCRFGADAGYLRQGGGITLLLHLLLAIGIGKAMGLVLNGRDKGKGAPVHVDGNFPAVAVHNGAGGGGGSSFTMP